MGLASASAIPSAQGAMGSIYDRPSKRKNYAFACFSAGNHLGFVFSSIFSGIAAHLLSWRASFWLLAIIYLVVSVGACFVCPADDMRTPRVTLKLLKQFDFVAVVLATTGIALFATGISIGPDAPNKWRTPYVIAFLVVGIVLLAAFIWWESRFQYPLMPMSIWRDRDFCLLLGILLLGFGSFTAMFFFCCLYLQDLFGYSSLITAVCLLPAAVSGVVVNIFAGRLLHRISNKLLMGIGACAFVIAFMLVALQRSGDSYWAFTFPALIIVVIGTDLEFNVVNVFYLQMYVVSSLAKSEQSTASSVFQTTIKLAVTVGLGMFAAIFTSISERPSNSGYYAKDPYEPYAAVFWGAAVMSFISVLLVPFLQVKTQGHKE
ncbi:hypothetical protein N0V94_009469 [Neodidymelliopsis sp. IMI 364377]|nr:hypothetical protein N0V94_009469 [Neodidymelliopsis sp. IMI 364377]